jgi:hypothetical protein
LHRIPAAHGGIRLRLAGGESGGRYRKIDERVDDKGM